MWPGGVGGGGVRSVSAPAAPLHPPRLGSQRGNCRPRRGGSTPRRGPAPAPPASRGASHRAGFAPRTPQPRVPASPADGAQKGLGLRTSRAPPRQPGVQTPPPPPWRLPPGTAASHLSSGHLWLDVHHLHALLGVALLAHGAAQPARLLPAPRRRTRCCLCHGTGSIAGGGRGWGRRLPGSRAVRLTGVPCRGRGFLRRWWHGVGGPGNRLR